ncbi:MAG: hypothetical protein IKT13_02475 [Paludibacteraceae bacterium]|nr:hypothetical protein [Paludibacteraceae bacterium]
MRRNYEDQAQRRARKVADIKGKFYQRMAEENAKPKDERMKIMDLYDEIGYAFYMSGTEIREIIAGRR